MRAKKRSVAVGWRHHPTNSVRIAAETIHVSDRRCIEVEVEGKTKKHHVVDLEAYDSDFDEKRIYDEVCLAMIATREDEPGQTVIGVGKDDA